MKTGKYIIVAEDDPAMQHAFTLILERAGHTVEMMANGEPLLTGEFRIPDVFVLDKQLSGVDGLDICRYLKSQPASAAIPVIMLSANPEIGRMSVEAGADGFLEKPFKMKSLLEMVEKYA